MENSNLLQEAIASIKAGQKLQAVPLLSEFIKTNPESEQGWLLMGFCLEKADDKKHCYQKVLEINPRNDRAQELLIESYLMADEEEEEEVRAKKAEKKAKGGLFKRLINWAWGPDDKSK